MKKLLFIPLLAIAIALTACSNSEHEIEQNQQQPKELQQDLLHQLVGTWEAEGEAYTITYDGSLWLNEEELTVLGTGDQMVYTELAENEGFSYDFKISEDQVTLYRNYGSEEGFLSGEVVGGPLAPIELTRKAT